MLATKPDHAEHETAHQGGVFGCDLLRIRHGNPHLRIESSARENDKDGPKRLIEQKRHAQRGRAHADGHDRHNPPAEDVGEMPAVDAANRRGDQKQGDGRSARGQRTAFGDDVYRQENLHRHRHRGAAKIHEPQQEKRTKHEPEHANRLHETLRSAAPHVPDGRRDEKQGYANDDTEEAGVWHGVNAPTGDDERRHPRAQSNAQAARLRRRATCRTLSSRQRTDRR